ncbi:hypothetical protein Tco_0132197 [Tanacetum coccineum]
MVAFLEKTDRNAEFHEIIDFLTRSSIHYAPTVSPVVSTTFVEQFWMTAKSKIVGSKNLNSTRKKLSNTRAVANLVLILMTFNSFCYYDDRPTRNLLFANHTRGARDALIMEMTSNTIPETESDEFIKSSVENLVPTPSESEDFSDIKFESFRIDYPNSGDSSIDVVEDIPVDVPNILPTHPALQLDFDFIPSHNDLGSDPDVSSPSGDRNKIYDPGICIEVESTRFLAPLSPVIDTLLPFSSENEDKVFNHSVLAYKEKSPPSSSHRGLKAFQLSLESPMMIHGDNTPNLGVRHPHFYPP